MLEKTLSETEKINNFILSQPANTIIDAAKIYVENFLYLSECDYYTALRLMIKTVVCDTYQKKLYYGSKKTRFGVVPLSQNKIIEYFSENDVALGYLMYNKYWLTTQVGKSVTILPENTTKRKISIGAITIKKAEFDIDSRTKPVLEVLDILQNYPVIKDLNEHALSVLLTSFCNGYSDNATQYVLQNCGHKNNTVVLLKQILDQKKVKNTLSQYLASAFEHET